MFSLSTFSTSLAPLPPTPMLAMLRRLFAPSTFRLATKGKDKAAAVIEACSMNRRRVRGVVFIMNGGGLIPPFILESGRRSRIRRPLHLKRSGCDKGQMTSYAFGCGGTDDETLAATGGIDMARAIQR